VGLPAAFLRLGFAGVIGTLWPVADVAAQLIVPSTLRRWLGGRPLAEALAEAQRWARDMNAEEAEGLLGRPMASEQPFASIRSWGAFTVAGA
jgi:CHAT domain-containing protein